MKKITPFLLCFFLITTGYSQDNDVQKKHYLKMYQQGMTYNDISTAITSLHGYIAMDNSLAYKDTLSMLYFSSKSYYSSLLLAEEVYKGMPDNFQAMARAAECYDVLGDPKTSVGLYEKVVLKTKNPFHIYKLAVGQYQLKRTLECEASARAVLADTSSNRIGVNFILADGNSQTVPISAAAANLLGVLQMEAKNYTQAKPFLTQALSIFPQFGGAKENMEICDKNLNPKSKLPAKTSIKPKG